jgi:hypothetical protein
MVAALLSAVFLCIMMIAVMIAHLGSTVKEAHHRNAMLILDEENQVNRRLNQLMYAGYDFHLRTDPYQGLILGLFPTMICDNKESGVKIQLPDFHGPNLAYLLSDVEHTLRGLVANGGLSCWECAPGPLTTSRKNRHREPVQVQQITAQSHPELWARCMATQSEIETGQNLTEVL